MLFESNCFIDKYPTAAGIKPVPKLNHNSMMGINLKESNPNLLGKVYLTTVCCKLISIVNI